MIPGYREMLPLSDIFHYLGVSRSSYYYQPRKRAPRTSNYTFRRMEDDLMVESNESIVQRIEDLLSREFVCYGYKKVTAYLRNQGYLINKKKVRRLMSENSLLNMRYNAAPRVRRVIERRLHLSRPNEVWEMDIKYVWIHGEARNAYLFVLLDCFTREEVGHYLGYSCRKEHVRMILEFAFHDRGIPAIGKVRIRSDNGSQFTAKLVAEYLEEMHIFHERIHPSTPEEDGFIEAFNSIFEREVIRRFEFESFQKASDITDRYMVFYNEERIHSAIGYKTPKEMYETWMRENQPA